MPVDVRMEQSILADFRGLATRSMQRKFSVVFRATQRAGKAFFELLCEACDAVYRTDKMEIYARTSKRRGVLPIRKSMAAGKFRFAARGTGVGTGVAGHRLFHGRAVPRERICAMERDQGPVFDGRFPYGRTDKLFRIAGYADVAV